MPKEAVHRRILSETIEIDKSSQKEYQKNGWRSMTTARTEAVEFQAVGFDGEAVASGDFLLKAFNVAVFKLHDLSAVCADEMVVMAFMGDIVVLGLRAEVPGLCQAGFAKEIERAVDRCQPQVWILFRQLVIHLLGGDVFLLEKGIENQLALAGAFQLMLPQVLFQRCDFFLMLRHGDQSNSRWRGH